MIARVSLLEPAADDHAGRRKAGTEMLWLLRWSALVGRFDGINGKY